MLKKALQEELQYPSFLISFSNWGKILEWFFFCMELYLVGVEDSVPEDEPMPLPLSALPKNIVNHIPLDGDITFFLVLLKFFSNIVYIQSVL